MSVSMNPAAPRHVRPTTAPRPALVRSRWLGRGLIAGGAALVPWMYVLATRLPSTAQVSNWSTAWLGLDAMLAAGLLGTGVLFTRGDPRHGLVAAATGALLVADAWFDVMTAAEGADRTIAIMLAAGAELPMAALCAALAVRAVSATGPTAGERRFAQLSGRMDSDATENAKPA